MTINAYQNDIIRETSIAKNAVDVPSRIIQYAIEDKRPDLTSQNTAA